MDENTSNLATAAVTGLVTLGGVWLTSAYNRKQTKAQAAAQAQLHLREPRKQTYAEFLHACRRTCDALEHLLPDDPDDANRAYPGSVYSVGKEHLPTISTAYAAVELEGQSTVVEAAYVAREVLIDLYLDAFGLDLGGVDETYSAGYTEEFRDAVKTFTKVASRALDPSPE